jgi:hypothetical protein
LTFGGGFLVSDGHHNRLLFVDLSGDVTQLVQFDNIVPTGLEIDGPKIDMGEAGPIPHDPADGKVVVARPNDPSPRAVTSGFSLIVDVEAASCGVHALSQGDSPGQVPAGSPALSGERSTMSPPTAMVCGAAAEVTPRAERHERRGPETSRRGRRA